MQRYEKKCIKTKIIENYPKINQNYIVNLYIFKKNSTFARQF